VTGPEHYAESERLLVAADDAFERAAVRASAEMSALAQTHAILALAAATAMTGIDRMPDEDFEAWDKVAGVPTRTEDE
jgi:hypothetical protein